MSVQSENKGDKLILTLDNGDLTKMQEMLKRWNFKDEQSFLRFSVSLLLETEDKTLWMKSNGEPVSIVPAKHSLKDGDNV